MTSDSLLSRLYPWRQLLVAFSGGLDSTVLLHHLVLLRDKQPELNIRAVHVHHGISLHADEWAAHCQAVCERWQVELTVVRVTLARDGSGLEAQARNARYQALEKQLRSDEALVTAQHLDDQCETFLLALKRGSGPAGLAAMPARLRFGNSELLRPLLSQPRQALEQWAQAHQLAWVEDESNHSSQFDRNFLRLDVLPGLSERWPHFASMVARSAALCGEQEQLLDELLEEELNTLVSGNGSLRISPLKTMSEAKRGALVRRWLARHNAAMPARAALARIWHEVAMSREDATPKLVLGDFAVRRYQDALWWVRERLPADRSPVLWPAPYAPLVLAGGTLRSGYGQAVRAPRADETVTIRYSAEGILHIVGRERGRTLKKLWQELGIPPWQRETTPLLFYGDDLIAAAGVFVTREGQATAGSTWFIDWQRND